MNAIEGLSQRAATVAQVMVSHLEAPTLPEHDLHHLTKVLRIRDGERVSVINGKGSWAICTWGSAANALHKVTDVIEDPLPDPIEVAFSPLKGDRNELVVQKLTELGVDCIQLLAAERTVVKWKGDKLDRNLERLHKIAYSAAMQSRRTRLPRLEAPMTLAEAIEKGFRLAMWGGETLSMKCPQVAIGPEGGWTPAELELCKEYVSIGTSVLRAETASIAAGALLSAARG